MAQRYRVLLGWIAVAHTVAASCFWAFWGIIENFHEGWYGSSIWSNLGLMAVQYLSPMIVFACAGLAGVRWPRAGGVLHIAAAIGAVWFFRGASAKVIYPVLAGPLVLMGVAYWFGRPAPRRWAVAVIVGFPLVTLVAFGAEPAYRVSRRFDDGVLTARQVTENGVNLCWAPDGPGWPRTGVPWDEAVRRCRYLSADGRSLAETRQDIWRLPTVEEAVRSMNRHGRSSNGTWDAARQVASYEHTPDKESPLWDVHSQVIYWWTATEVNEQQALIVVYDGKVWPRPKKARWGYLGFRAVKAGAGTGE